MSSSKLKRIHRDLRQVVLALEMAKLANFDFIGDPDDLPRRTPRYVGEAKCKVGEILEPTPLEAQFLCRY